MISIEGSESKPVLWPGGSLKGFGTNPAGDPIWRVTWAPSRTFLFGGRHIDRDAEGDIVREFVGYRHLPLYMGKNLYVLERWLAPLQYAKCSPEMWEIQNRDQDTGLNRMGPYPHAGEYFGPCWEFKDYPTLGAVEAVISLLTRCHLMSEAEKKILEIKAAETEKIIGLHKAKEKILDTLPLRVTDGLLSSKAMAHAEDIPERFSAQDIAKQHGLKLGNGKMFTAQAERI